MDDTTPLPCRGGLTQAIRGRPRGLEVWSDVARTLECAMLTSQHRPRRSSFGCTAL